MIKLIGIVIIGISAAMIGYKMAGNMKQRITLLDEISKILQEISNEATYSMKTLPEIVYDISKKDNSVCNRWLSNLWERLDTNKDAHFVNAWENSMECLTQTTLKAEDIELIKPLGRRIINLNNDMLAGVIKNMVETIDVYNKYLKDEYRVKSGLYRKLGILAGIFIIIIVI